MKFQTRFAFLLGAITVSVLFAAAASAQFLPGGAPCGPTSCRLGPQSNTRGQIGNGLPLPITAKPGQTGAITNANDRVVPGYVLGIPGAPISVGQSGGGPNPSISPATITFPPGQFRSPGPLVKLPVFNFNQAVFQVNTSLLISNPRVGLPSPTVMAGGRTGPATVTYCPGDVLPAGTLPAGNPGCVGQFPGAAGIPGVQGSLFNGIARYQKTKNQFGGPARGRTTGANNGPACTALACNAGGARVPGTANATVYQNVAGLTGMQLPCDPAVAAPGVCQVAISVPVPITDGVFGGPFGAVVSNPLQIQLSAVRTANIGGNGTILSIGALVPAGGPFFNGAWPRQGVTSFGLPGTTGMLTISVSAPFGGGAPERFIRTGFDGRDASGNGIVNIVGGALSNRSFSGPNANRTWATYYLPEPGALVAGASALMMLGGCHLLVRRRR
jgi:hypothetical protein